MGSSPKTEQASTAIRRWFSVLISAKVAALAFRALKLVLIFTCGLTGLSTAKTTKRQKVRCPGCKENWGIGNARSAQIKHTLVRWLNLV